jgi:hypothetical protein
MASAHWLKEEKFTSQEGVNNNNNNNNNNIY